MKLLLIRWLKFNAVGALGVGVQLGTLTALTSGLGLNYLAATALAVEAAVLHNFFWHQCFTWRDRAGIPGALALRLISFHGTNGLVSLVGNLFFMRVLVGLGRMPYLPANALAILSCSVINFLLAELVVFVAAPKHSSNNP